MPLVIDSVSPPQGRSGSVVHVEGSGFGYDKSLMQVLAGNIPATILQVSDEQMDVLMPAGLPTNRQVSVIITDQTDATNTDNIAWFVRSAVEAVPATSLVSQEPSFQEDTTREVPARPEAKDFERATCRADCLARELLPSAEGAARVGVSADALASLGSPLSALQALVAAALRAHERRRTILKRIGFFGTAADGGPYPRAEQDLVVVELPAGSLPRDGDQLHINMAGEIGEEPAPERVLRMRLYFGGTILSELRASYPGRFGAAMEAMVVRSSSSSQQATASGYVGGRIAGLFNQGRDPKTINSSPAEDLDGPVIIRVTGQEVSGTGGAEASLVAVTALRLDVVRRPIKATARAIADEVSISEFVATDIRTFRRTINDTIAIPNGVHVIIPERRLNEAPVDTTDQVRVAVASFPLVELDERAQATDQVRTASAWHQQFADIEAVVDAVLAQKFIAPVLGDAVTASDSISRNLMPSRFLVDFASVKASMSSDELFIGRGGGDALGATDALQTEVPYVREVVDAVAVTDLVPEIYHNHHRIVLVIFHAYDVSLWIYDEHIGATDTVQAALS